MKGLAKKIVTILFAALLIIPTFVAWISATMKMAGVSETEGMLLSDIDEFAVEILKSGEMLNLSKIFFWVTFGIAMLLILLVVLQMVAPKVAVLNTLVKITGIALLVSAIATFVFATIFCIANSESQSFGAYSMSVTYYPLWGSAITLLGGLVAGLCALCGKKK